MNVINRYLAVQVLMGLGIATVVLLPLFGFLDLLDQLDDVGKGTYRVQDAFLHTALLLPRRFIQLAPVYRVAGQCHRSGATRCWVRIDSFTGGRCFSSLVSVWRRSRSG